MWIDIRVYREGGCPEGVVENGSVVASDGYVQSSPLQFSHQYQSNYPVKHFMVEEQVHEAGVAVV